MAPGECIIHDRGGEFCNKLVRALAADFGVNMRCIAAGRPMANGQAESAVKSVKQKLKTLALQNGNVFFVNTLEYKNIKKIFILRR